jgi:hypothetical protein
MEPNLLYQWLDKNMWDLPHSNLHYTLQRENVCVCVCVCVCGWVWVGEWVDMWKRWLDVCVCVVKRTLSEESEICIFRRVIDHEGKVPVPRRRNSNSQYVLPFCIVSEENFQLKQRKWVRVQEGKWEDMPNTLRRGAYCPGIWGSEPSRAKRSIVWLLWEVTVKFKDAAFSGIFVLTKKIHQLMNSFKLICP